MFAIMFIMRMSKAKKMSPRRRLHIKIAGLITFAAGLALLVALVLLHGPSIFIFIAVVFVVCGMVLVAEPEAVWIVFEVISWLP
jgi:Flp pilus assembly protein TadB